MEVSFNEVFVWLASTVVFVIGVRIYLQAVEIAAELSGGMSGKAEPDDVPILPHK